MINILSFDDNNVYEFCLRQCGTLILCNFHFRNYIKSMHKISARSTDSEGSTCNIRTWSGKTLEDGQAESEHGSMEASEELEIRSRSTEVLMVSRSEALQGQKTRRCFAPSCLTLMIFKRCLHKHQIRSKYKMAGYAD